MTKQRAAIIKVMRENCGHFTAEEIFLLANEEYPSIVRATIYNNLNGMVEEGSIRRICQSGQPDRFDRNPIPHEHIICTGCGKKKCLKHFSRFLSDKMWKFNILFILLGNFFKVNVVFVNFFD